MSAALHEMAEEPLLQFADLENRRYTLLIYTYLLGQFRLQITDLERPDAHAPAGHGAIVQELCTYCGVRLAAVVTDLRQAREPLELARSWARPWNCDGPGARIRLDSTEAAEAPLNPQPTTATERSAFRLFEITTPKK